MSSRLPPLWAVLNIKPGDGSEGTDLTPAQVLSRNQPFVQPLYTSFNTKLSPAEEQKFRAWVADHHVPFNPNSSTSDYDMRGFWKALTKGDARAKTAIDPNDSKIHFPDFWKTPYDVTFSNQSKFATPAAPAWRGDALVAPDGRVMFDDARQQIGEPIFGYKLFTGTSQ